MASALEKLVDNGILGALLVLSLFSNWYLYRAQQAETAARIQDSKENTGLLLRIQQATTDAVSKVHELMKARQDK